MLGQRYLCLYEFSYLTAAGASDPNGAVGAQGAALLIPNITDMQNTIKSLNLKKHLPVGTSDAGAYFNTQVLQAVEFGVSFSLYRRFIRGYTIPVRWQMITLGSATCQLIRQQRGPISFSRRIMSQQRQM